MSKPEQNVERRILAANMWAGLNFDSTRARYDGFLGRAKPAFVALIESTLLHDVVVVPTEDYLNLTAMVDVLGAKPLIEALEAGVLRFCRVKGALAYVGNGGGIVHVTLPFQGDGTDPTAVGADPDVAVAWALRALKTPPDAKLAKLAVANTTEYDLFSATDIIAAASYRDFAELPIGNGKDAKRLAGVTARELRILGGQDLGPTIDDIGVVLALATANLEMQLMNVAGASDSATSTPLGHALRAHEIRSHQSHEAFLKLLELLDVPDIGDGVLQNNIQLSQLLSLRESRAGREFRKWFHENCSTDPGVVAKAYIELLSQVPHVSSTRGKVLRFVITTLMGLIPAVGAIAGAAASFVDSFILEKLAERCSPKFFIEQLKQIETPSEQRDA